ncbi:unnamed protein product [Pseudo-nitzschia multistriata]|uniref:Uncharacterized protein n=1 Tax=Pseudo-nitzschia multistriata TaxID=183589 RepID=A0A448YVG6_9STRA|nr:unnamed protein product [Pseudo-nitzschia multistriata]
MNDNQRSDDFAVGLQVKERKSEGYDIDRNESCEHEHLIRFLDFASVKCGICGGALRPALSSRVGDSCIG